MADKITQRYTPYFSVLVFHHYFLDDGRKVFLFDETKKQPELSDYDVRKFLKITPTPTTATLLKNTKAIFKATSVGFMVLAPVGTSFKESLEFVIVPTDPLFVNYTAHTLRGQPVKTYSYKKENEVHTFRVKQNVFELTNKGKTSLNLSEPPKQVVGSVFAENLFEIAGELLQATQDDADASTFKNIEKPLNESLPIFVNQNDIPDTIITFVEAVQTTDGSTVWVSKSETIRGIQLPEGFPTDVFIWLKINPTTAHFGGSSPPIFKIHLKSRATFWYYFEKATGAYKPESPDYWSPLTLRGKRTNKRQPTPDVITVKKGDENDKIIKLISEINP